MEKEKFEEELRKLGGPSHRVSKILAYVFSSIVVLFLIFLFLGWYWTPSKLESINAAREVMRGKDVIENGKKVHMRVDDKGIWYKVPDLSPMEYNNVRKMVNTSTSVIWAWEDQEGITHLSDKDPRTK